MVEVTSGGVSAAQHKDETEMLEQALHADHRPPVEARVEAPATTIEYGYDDL